MLLAKKIAILFIHLVLMNTQKEAERFRRNRTERLESEKNNRRNETPEQREIRLEVSRKNLNLDDLDDLINDDG